MVWRKAVWRAVQMAERMAGCWVSKMVAARGANWVAKKAVEMVVRWVDC